jgi:hypothetical protein
MTQVRILHLVPIWKVVSEGESGADRLELLDYQPLMEC